MVHVKCGETGINRVSQLILLHVDGLFCLMEH